MAGKRSAWGRINAWLDFEVSAETLEAYRRASVLVAEIAKQAEDRRLACRMDGVDPWTLPPGTRAGLLCAWNAVVLQTLGDALLHADAADTPRSAGFVPRPLRDEAALYYAEVGEWLHRAEQGFANPEYRLDCTVPAPLPVPAPEPFAVLGMHDARPRGLLAGLRAVRELADQAMTLLPAAVTGRVEQAQLLSIRQQHESARDAARQAEELYERAPVADVERAVEHARAAIASFYELGQLAADPTRARGAEAPRPQTTPPPRPPHEAKPAPRQPPPPTPRARPPAAPRPEAPRPAAAPGRMIGRLPGGRTFDLWCLTDPDARSLHVRDRHARSELRRMWELDPDPERTLALHQEVQAAFDRGIVVYAADPWGRIGHFYRCPWGPVYVAREAVTLGGQPIPEGRQFILEVSADGMERGHGFTRRVFTGSFERMTWPEHGNAWGARYVSPRLAD